jgi:AcrR family transcriptional regulator
VSEAPIPPKRARTATEKLTRRRVLLQAAQVQFCERGFEGFSMAELARQAGVAKGTLYLYFETREEVLLTLYCDALDTWQASLVRTVPPKCSHAAFADAFYAAAHADALFLPLMSRLDSVIEHNVSLTTLIDAKRAMARQIAALTEYLTQRLDLTPAQAFDAIRSLASLLLGAAQVDLGPELNEYDVPEDVRRLTEAFASEPLFVSNACRILRGIRAGQ